MRKIAIYDSFTEPKHRRLIDETAARAGFTVDYYAAPAAVPADKRGDYEVIYGMPKPGELKDFVNLKWFCGSFAGVDAYLDDSLYPSPEVMLSNSYGAYGVTIAEHMVMVTLMLLRHAPVYCADQAAGHGHAHNGQIPPGQVSFQGAPRLLCFRQRLLDGFLT